jgi:hypothetical protein
MGNKAEQKKILDRLIVIDPKSNAAKEFTEEVRSKFSDFVGGITTIYECVDGLTKEQQETVGRCAFEIFLVCGGPERMDQAGMGIKIKGKAVYAHEHVDEAVNYAKGLQKDLKKLLNK